MKTTFGLGAPGSGLRVLPAGRVLAQAGIQSGRNPADDVAEIVAVASRRDGTRTRNTRQERKTDLMDVRFINPFIAAVKHVFKTMLQADIMVSKARLKGKDEPCPDVSAVIGLSGDAVGSVVLAFPMSTATRSAGQFAGTPMTPDHEDCADALGELANMVAGQAKAHLDGLSVSISLPNVIVGRDHRILESKHAPKLVIPCDSALGRFAVEVAMVVEKKPEMQLPAPATVSANS